MTSFVHLNYSTQHPGLARVESAMGAVQDLGKGISSAGGVAAASLMALAALGKATSQVASSLVRRVDAFSRLVAQARHEWTTLGAQLASRSPRSE